MGKSTVHCCGPQSAGCLVLGLTLLIGNQDYNGAGDAVIRRMLLGETIPQAFLLKILFTALTLGAGFRGRCRLHGHNRKQNKQTFSWVFSS